MTAASRAGEVWEDKPRGRACGDRHAFVIVGWIDLADLNARVASLDAESYEAPGLWVGLTRSIFGRPFLFTIAEDVLRRAHRRVTDHERSTA